MSEVEQGNIRIMIVDDQELMRDGLRVILDKQDGITVVSTAEDGQEAVEKAAEHQPDVILMDVRMPVMDGIMAAHTILRKFPAIRILMLTTFDDDTYVKESLQAGSVGYILKDVPAQDLADAVRLAYRGIYQLGGEAAARIVNALRKDPEIEFPMDSDAANQVNHLTEREREVLLRVASGANNQEIAAQLFISEGTVKSHISSILSQLHLRDRTQLAIFVHQHKLL